MAVKKEFEEVEFHANVSFFSGLIMRIGELITKAITIELGDMTVTLGDLILSQGSVIVLDGDITFPALGKLYMDGGNDTYLWQKTSNQMSWVGGGLELMYNTGWGMFFPRGVHIIAVDKTANSSSDVDSAITIAETMINVVAVDSGVTDIIFLPRADQIQNGHKITIMCDAGSAFEIRTPSTRADKINDVDCGTGDNEYLATDEEVITCVMRNVTDGWVLTAVTKLGAVATAVVPDA